MTVAYKEYELKASSNYLPERNKWDSKLTIIKLQDKDGNMRFQDYLTKDTFNSEQEAIESALLTGKVIVDGQHPEFMLPF